MFRRLNLLVFASAVASGCVHSPVRDAVMAPPQEELAEQLYAEIWSDLQSNAMIGNGNWLAARWANAGSGQNPAPKLHIEDLLCGGSATLLRCRFGLLREGGVTIYLGEPTPDKLTCTTNFRRPHAGERWAIPRLPPGKNGGHSRIAIECQPLN